MPNYRGGPGHGEAFEAWRCHHGPRFEEWNDVESAVDEAIGRGIADPSRLGIGGWSYGGYMSGWAVTQTRRYSAAVMGAGVYSHGAAILDCDIPVTYRANVGTAPWDGPGPLPHDLASPITYASAARTPSLILHGEEDVRVPVSQSKGMYRALRAFDCPVELVIYPREGHFIREPRHRADILTRVRSWYERWLPGASAAR
jgi:dipeptidyl aminopeptidase/acylaminoacyl peptidase